MEPKPGFEVLVILNVVVFPLALVNDIVPQSVVVTSKPPIHQLETLPHELG